MWSLPISRFCSKTPFPSSLPGLFSPSQGQWHSERGPRSSVGSGRREETEVSGTQQYAVWTLPCQGFQSPCGYPSFVPLKSQAWTPCVGLDMGKQLSPLIPHPKGGRLNRRGRGTPPKDPATLCSALGQLGLSPSLSVDGLDLGGNSGLEVSLFFIVNKEALPLSPPHLGLSSVMRPLPSALQGDPSTYLCSISTLTRAFQISHAATRLPLGQLTWISDAMCPELRS